jgi:SAM-dependent methyltransferase
MAAHSMAIKDLKDRRILEKNTRSVFHRIHLAQAGDEKVFNRLIDMLNTGYLGLERNFFKGKVCLDAGCGSNFNGTLALLRMGAGKVCAFDLDRSILKKLPAALKDYRGRYDISTGNILNIKFEEDTFDFTHCSGVLHHCADASLGIKELARVTKPGGLVYVVMHGKGGIIRDMVSVLRDKYAADKAFKKLIDNLEEDWFEVMWGWLFNSMRENADAEGARILTPSLIRELFDKDLVLTIKDRITAPVYNEYTEKQVRAILKRCGLINIRRLTRYPKLKNVRRFLCPFYYEYDSPFSRVLFGEGCLQLMGTKR